MKYSIILLDYDPEYKLVGMRAECKRRIHANSKGHDYELIIADEKGIHKSIKNSVAKATGEYLIIMGNDVMLNDPAWLTKICQPNSITGWKWTEFHMTGQPEVECSCIGMERKIWDELGGLDSQFEGAYGYDDNDLLLRARLAGYANQVIPVDLEHGESRTFHAYYDFQELGKQTERNKKLFIEKWKHLPEIQKYLSSL